MEAEKPEGKAGQATPAGAKARPESAAPAKLDIPNAEEIARISARWIRARELEEKRRIRAERWRKRLWAVRETFARPFRAVENALEDAGQAVMEPFRGVMEAVAKWREEQERIRQEKWLAKLPIREEAARKKWEKKRVRQEARLRKREELLARFAGMGKVFTSPAEKYRAFEAKLRDFFLAPFHAIAAAHERAAVRRIQRQQAKLELTRESRESAIQKRHTKLMIREERKRMSRLRWRKRLSGVRNAWQWSRRMWRNTQPIRILIYIVAAVVLVVVYRNQIATKLSSFTGFNLQSLMK